MNMFRIRFHGRGGQGVKTASRILGSAFFLEGYEVQDAPRYGPERRGAPIFAYVRASRGGIHERGAIASPDMVVVVDGSLMSIPSAGVMEGVEPETLLLLGSAAGAGQANLPATVIHVPDLGGEGRGVSPLTAVAAAGAAARLSGVISAASLREAVREELESLEEKMLAINLELALSAFQRMEGPTLAEREGVDSPVPPLVAPVWIELPRDAAHMASPTILGAGTSVLLPTGLWRTNRPEIDLGRCKGCWWICATFCPDGAVGVTNGGKPEIDYEHCKGCLICMEQCPSHAIGFIPEGAETISPHAGGGI